MIRALRSRALFACLIAVGLLAPGVSANPATQAAKDDGKAFGTVLKPRGEATVQTAPTADSVPNFTAGTQPQSHYFDNPGAMETSGAAQATMHEGSTTVRSSMSSRATFPKVDLDATIARANTINEDPLSYTTGMAAGGTGGTCRQLPPNLSSPGFYEQSCDVGYVREESTKSCAILVRHEVTTQTQYEYHCSHYNAQFNRVNDCAIIEPAGCEWKGSHPGRCLQRICGPGGRNCGCAEPGEPIEEYWCPVQVPGGTLIQTHTTRRVNRIVDDSQCAAPAADGSCTAGPDVCVDSDPQTRTIDGAPITEACWGWNRTYRCTNLSAREDCSDLEGRGCTFLRQECITEEDPCLTTTRVYSCGIPPEPTGEAQYICDGDVYCLNGECETIEREPNTEFRDAAVALNSMKEAGRQLDPNTLTLFRGTRNTCTKLVFGIKNCCAPRGVPLLGGCDAEDRALKLKREEGLCHYVGTFCSDKVLGVCVARKETHCCYESKLSRILQEQGRPQIGWAWDTAKREQCRGFTVDQFSRLDLSRMDFSEVYAEFVDAARLPDDLATAADLQAKIEAYYASNAPN